MVTVARGYFIRQLEKTAPTLDALMADLLESEIPQIVVRLADGVRGLPDEGVIPADMFADRLAFLAENTISVWGWGACYAHLSSEQQAQTLAGRLEACGVS
ncbi:MAG: hypothetical protein AAFQ07_11505, partial [Chloroflexota bacterium]